MARIAAAVALAAVLAAGCTNHAKHEPAAPNSTAATITTAVPPAVDDSSRADWLRVNGYPAWTLGADTLQQHFRALCRQLAAASVPGKEHARARLVRQWNADVQTAVKAGFGEMELEAVRVSDHPASIEALQRAGGGC